MRKKFFSGRMILVLLLCLGIGGYQAYTYFTQRETEEPEITGPLTHDDTVQINAMYTQLAALYATALKDTTTETEMLVGIDTASLPRHFTPRAVTCEALRCLFDSSAIKSQNKQQRDAALKSSLFYQSEYRLQNLNYSLGDGSFIEQLAHRHYDRPFANATASLLRDGYILVLTDQQWKAPVYNDTTGTFAAGSYKGSLRLYDLRSGKKQGGIPIVAFNDAGISAIPGKKEEMERKLLTNLHENIRKAVNHASAGFFGRSL